MSINLVTVPNGRVAGMIVINYALPEPEQAASGGGSR
jgi:hypothetical protein